MSRRAPAALIVCLALTVAACNAAASSSTAARQAGGHAPGPGSPADSAPARDTFVGSIVSGTRAYSGFQSRVKIYLHPHGSGQTRAVRVVIRDACGNDHGNCHPVTGSLTGRLVRSGHQLPDTGEHYALTGRGRVSPLGRTRAAGAIEGTGFIARGQEVLRLRLRGRSGTVTVQAQTRAIRGFRSP